MTLKQWAANGWLKEHAASRAEISGLDAIVARDLEDAARTELSADWRFGIACNAVLKLCTILLHASGYRVERSLHHYRILQALPLILGTGRAADADYLDACRVKRNTGGIRQGRRCDAHGRRRVVGVRHRPAQGGRRVAEDEPPALRVRGPAGGGTGERRRPPRGAEAGAGGRSGRDERRLKTDARGTHRLKTRARSTPGLEIQTHAFILRGRK